MGCFLKLIYFGARPLAIRQAHGLRQAQGREKHHLTIKKEIPDSFESLTIFDKYGMTSGGASWIAWEKFKQDCHYLNLILNLVFKGWFKFDRDCPSTSSGYSTSCGFRSITTAFA